VWMNMNYLAVAQLLVSPLPFPSLPLPHPSN
jgi:hypothetical protein